MRKHIILALKYWQPLYNLTSRVYYFLQWVHLAEMLIGTRAREWQWKRRDISEGYWNNRSHPSKYFLLEKTDLHKPESILEVGCAAGANLYLLTKRYPDASIVGIDINRAAVEYGTSMFARKGIRNVTLINSSIDLLDLLPDKHFDLVFSSALLIYIGPDKIQQVIKQMLAVSRKSLILMECHTPGNQKTPREFYSGGIWLRDYKALLRNYISEEHLTITKIPEDIWPDPPWKEHGYIIEVKSIC